MKRDYITNPHQLDLLEKYFPIDRENKIITIKIYYEKSTDMLDFSVGELHKEMLQNEVLEKITEITDKIPVGYKANVLFIIDDYCGYSPKALLEKLNDLIEINNYQILHEKKKNCIIASILVLIGFVLLFMLGIEKRYNWISEGLAKDVLEEMIDITSWVFIWQAVTVLFLMPSDLVKIGVKFITKISTVSFCSKDETVLISEKQTDIVENFEVESKKANFKKITLLITSTIILALGIYRFGGEFISLTDSIQAQDDKFTFANFFYSAGVDIITILMGLTGILYYRGDLRAKKPLHILSIVMLIAVIIQVILCILAEIYLKIFTSGFLIIVEALFVYSALGTNKKRSNSEETKE